MSLAHPEPTTAASAHWLAVGLMPTRIIKSKSREEKDVKEMPNRPKCASPQQMTPKTSQRQDITVMGRKHGRDSWGYVYGLRNAKNRKRRGQWGAVQGSNEDASTVTVVCGPARSLGLQVPAAKMKVSRPTGNFSRKW